MLTLRAIALLALPALVGHLFYRAFVPPGARDSLGATLFLQLLAGFLPCGWLALLLAEAGWFSLLRWALLLLCGSAAVVALRWPQVRRWRWPRPQSPPKKFLPALLLFLALAVLWAYPGEPILGGQDPGVYVAIGASIAQSGGIVRHDPWVATLAEQERPLVLHYHIDQWWQTPGFFVTDFASGEVTPQFLHLYPVWLALFYAAGGLELALLATPLLMLLGLVSVFFFVRRTLGPWPALATTALLGLNPALIWFAREPNAESLVLPLLFGGWYLLDRALGEPARRDLATLAGLALGLVALTKLEFLVLPAVVYVYFMLRSFVQTLHPNEKHFLLVHSVLVGHAAVHLLLISHPYLYAFRASMENSHFLSFAAVFALGLAALLGVLLLVLLRRSVGRLLARLLDRPVLVQNALPALWLLLALYGTVIWPLLGPAQVYAYEQWWPNLNRWSFLRIGWYFSPVGFALAIAGLFWWLRRRLHRSALPFMGTLFFQLSFYIHTTLADPFHFWMMRRYVPLIFPCLAIGIATALWWVRQAPLGPALRRGGALLLLGLLLFLSVQADAPFASRRELLGTQAFLKEMADQVPDGVPLLIKPMGSALSAPLRYLYGKAVYSLPQPEVFEPDPPVPWESLWPLLQVWPPDTDTAYLLLRSDPMTFYGGTTVQEVGRFGLETERIEQSYDYLPKHSVPIRIQVLLYRVQQRPEAPHSLELSFEEPVWSGGGITITMPAPDTPLRLQLQASGFRPGGLPPARIQVAWSGQPVTERILDRSFDILNVELWLPPPPSAAQGDPVQLQITCPTWNPQATGFSDDPRDLGILLQSIRLEEMVPLNQK